MFRIRHITRETHDMFGHSRHTEWAVEALTARDRRTGRFAPGHYEQIGGACDAHHAWILALDLLCMAQGLDRLPCHN